MYPYYEPERSLTNKEMKKIAKFLNDTRDHDLNRKKKKEEEERKLAEAGRQRRMLAIEWYVLGIVMQPVIWKLYHIGMAHLDAFTPK